MTLATTALTPTRLRALVAATLIPLALAVAPVGLPSALAQEPGKVVATVNGKPITESDMTLAEADIGSDLGNLPEATRRRVLLEYLIENHLFAEAAEGRNLGSGPVFDQHMQYWRRRALRDTFFESNVKSTVEDREVRKYYDGQVSGSANGEEVRARHILVDSEIQAKEIYEKIAYGATFEQMARQFSKDPGSKDVGGDLGYFGRGQMVPPFEEAAFGLPVGDVSDPVKSQFGWHLIKVVDKRKRQAPDFDTVKERIKAALIHRKAQEIAGQLRGNAKIEYIDPGIKKHVEGEAPGGRGQ